LIILPLSPMDTHWYHKIKIIKNTATITITVPEISTSKISMD